MILNRAIEAARRLHPRRSALIARARAAGERVPVVVIPGMFGSRLVDGAGRVVWGSTARLYFGPNIPRAIGARADRVLDAIAVVPGLYGYDCHGGLLRFLVAAGWRPGVDLAPFAYDWRAGVAAAGRALAGEVARRGRVDLVAISTGGQVARWLLANGGAAAVRRVIYLGAPQRGTFDALASLHRGFRFAPAGKRFDGAEAALCQTSLDALPHPDEPLFLDAGGAPLPLDLYAASTWRELRLAPWPLDGGFAERLARARELHRALDAPSPHRDAWVIGARHLPTPARVLVVDGRARVPPPAPRPGDPCAALGYLPGDGELPEASLRALPALDERRLRWVTPPRHNRLPADPDVHALILEALLA